MLLRRANGDQAPRDAESDPLPPLDLVAGHALPDVEALYRAHRPRLLRFFERAASTEVAQDLCQQLFLRLARRRPATAIEAPTAYLLRSARNLLVDHHRHRERQGAMEAGVMDADQIGGADPAAALEARDALRRLEAALARLKPRTREIFLAHRFDGLSYREIAERTGLGVKAVEKHMSRAIAHIDRLSG